VEEISESIFPPRPQVANPPLTAVMTRFVGSSVAARIAARSLCAGRGETSIVIAADGYDDHLRSEGGLQIGGPNPHHRRPTRAPSLDQQLPAIYERPPEVGCITRWGARILDLRAAGYEIVTEKERAGRSIG
jgi:hypothetical protein